MAKSKVDENREMMFADHGTRCLITDTAADKYLDRAKKHGTDRYSKWCGGKDGFDDYAERLH
jgi:hypothetical protein